MASVVIAGDVSGTCTLQAANAAGTTVLTLPTTSGTLVATNGSPTFVTVTSTTDNTTTLNATTGNITTVTAGLGNASAPSITFTGDTNTGIFSPTADTIAFTEGGAEAMRIDSSGNVGIGTSSPSVKMEIRSAANSPQLVLTGTASRGLRISTSNPDGQNDATVIYNAQDTEAPGYGQHIWQSGGTERMRLTPAGLLQFNSGYGAVTTAYGTRAWVNFAGATGTINASGGVSSVTRNGTGDYSVNYSFTFPDANYTMWGMGRRNSGSQRPVLMCLSSSATYNQFTTYARFYTMLNDSATIEDPIQFWFGAIR